MSRLKHSLREYATSKPIVEALGGLDVLAEEAKHVAALNIPSCPFCGGEAVVTLGALYTLPAVSVECDHCHNGATRFTAGFDLLTQEHEDIFRATDKAVARWSMRKEATA